MILGLSLRGTSALIKAPLATSVHPNPGPGIKRGRRGKGDDSRSKICQGKYDSRKERSRERKRLTGALGTNVSDSVCGFVTRIVQGLPIKENNRNRYQRRAEKVVRGWW